MTDTNKSDGPLIPAPSRAMQHRAFSLMPSSLGEAREIALMIANSDFAPKDYKGKPDNVIVALQMGADLGLKPMQALQNIAIINGRPSVYGDAALALVMPALDRFVETFEGAENTDAFTAVCIAKRKGWPDETRRTFSVGDAKKAGLWGKSGPWSTYTKRMMQFRARGFCLRDVGADLLLGLILAEEAEDYPTVEVVGSSSVVSVAQLDQAPPALERFQQLPEALRDSIEKGFAELNIANGARLAKLNEFFGGDAWGEDHGLLLQNWLRDEYAKRKTGKPREKKSNDKGNAPVTKAAEPAASVPPAAASTPAPVQDVAQSQPATPVEDALF